MEIRHKSDCALHNAPAYESKPCDCGGEKAMLDAVEMIVNRGEKLLKTIENGKRLVLPTSDFKVALAVLEATTNKQGD